MKFALNQTATYWGTPTQDGYGGFTFDDPVEVDCKWQGRNELFIDSKGNEVRSRAVVYLDQYVDEGGYLHLGTLDDLDSSSEPPKDVNGCWQIRRVDKSWSISADDYLVKVWL